MKIRSAALVLPCTQLESTLAFFEERLGFRLESIFPADDPVTAILSGHGVRIQLEVGHPSAPGTLRLECEDPPPHGEGGEALTAPNGTRIEWLAQDAGTWAPTSAPAFSLSRMGEDSVWKTGRAGMRYRDLVPDRQGGRLIASHIAIPDGGPVPDYVHHHRVHFQLIYCYRGWVRVVYEDQGEPIVMRPGDCVLQPPGIRHRVLECSDGLEVVELTSPSAHPTFADHELALPGATMSPGRRFDGQRFHLHAAAEDAGTSDGEVQVRDLGLREATGGIIQAQVSKGTIRATSALGPSEALLKFIFVLEGGTTLSGPTQEPSALKAGDALVLPRGLDADLRESSRDVELLTVSLLS